MEADGRNGGFRLIVGVHDLAEQPDARGDELRSWVPFSRARPLLERAVRNALAGGSTVEVTSDDGFRSDYDLLMPWLLERGVRGTFFIATRLLGQAGRLTVAQLREMAAHGMRIGCHGARHVDWARIGERAFVEDVREGRDALEQALGLRVDLAAPPFGSYDGVVVRRLLAAGFREIHTCRGGFSLEREALKPRNMLKDGNVEAVLATSLRKPGFREALRCRARRARVLPLLHRAMP